MPPQFSTSSKLADTVLRRLKGAARKEKWGGAFIKLAWTAGPVTYLALQGGYYIAYHEAVPPILVLYFAAYTTVAGIFALATRFAYNLTRGSDKEEDLLVLESAFDTLPQRIVEIRNLQLQSLDSLSRNILSAKYLLENPQGGSDAAATAILDITGDKELAEEMTALEVYRGNGLYCRAEEKSRDILKLLEPHMASLNRISENVGTLIMDRISEDTGLGEYGRQRTYGFISRVLQASENDNLDFMTLQDAEEVCILIFELLNNRSFPHYTTEYRGDSRYREAALKLSRTRRDYRRHIYRRNNAIRILAEELYRENQLGKSRKYPSPPSRWQPVKKRKGIQRLLATIPQIRSARTLQQRIAESMREMVRTGAGTGTPHWGRIQNLYRNLYKNVRSLEKSYQKFRQAWQGMQQLIDQPSRSISGEKDQQKEQTGKTSRGPIRLIQGRGNQKGIAIRTSQVFLPDKKILPVARMIHEKLEEFNTIHENLNININDQKELAIDLLLIMDLHLPLENTFVQRAIELTRSAYISRGNTKGKARGFLHWSLRLVEGEEYPGKHSLHDMMNNLVRYEYLQLDEEDYSYLEETYGADQDFLRTLHRDDSPEGPRLFPVEPPEKISTLEDLLKKA